MKKLNKITAMVLSAAAATLSCTSMAAGAAEVDYTGYVSGGDVDDTACWGIDDYADNIKTIYKMDFPEQEDVIDEIVDGFLDDDEFIGFFERGGGSAFLIVEEALRDVLDPDAMPITTDNNLYYTKYTIPLIKQKTGYSDGASAAVLMALYGCGKYTSPNSDAFNDTRQSALINEMAWSTSNQTTVGEITRTMRRYFSGSNGFDFQTKSFSDRNKAVSAMAVGLSLNTAPVVRIPDGSSYYYGVVKEIEYNEDSIKIIDPRTGSINDITFNDFGTLITKSNGVIWMSVYAQDNSAQAIEQVKSEYPSEKSYFTYDGGECKGHADHSTCRYYDDAWQCAGFARYVFDKVKGRKYTTSISEASVTGFGKRGDYSRLDGDTSFLGEELTVTTAKKYLQGLPTGAYVRVKNKNDNSAYPYHSFSVLETSDTGITIYEANVGGKCLVRISDYTWAGFANKYCLLFYVD